MSNKPLSPLGCPCDFCQRTLALREGHLFVARKMLRDNPELTMEMVTTSLIEAFRVLEVERAGATVAVETLRKLVELLERNPLEAAEVAGRA